MSSTIIRAARFMSALHETRDAVRQNKMTVLQVIGRSRLFNERNFPRVMIISCGLSWITGFELASYARRHYFENPEYLAGDEDASDSDIISHPKFRASME
eukprot:CAMPEP_0198130048 /NCGR_PEP_ID=MMETSP1442-20131203/53061_1 /TAXON_ID= /ORGANISM="Craspedostauros australis, Strain CCMP3328" /LENGTH=99 /DNA_ID=CAMNT_0043790571 /DNA_START=159 /DNA_END=458 /DNA_ORIENTATION=-